MSKYFITGGGTGGHIYPAMAIADALCADSEIFYVGNPKNLEYEIAMKKGYKFLGVNVQGMPRNFGLKFIKWLFLLFASWLKCRHYLAKYKPDAVIGTGGYVCAPVFMAAISGRVPFIIHDCDAQPGLVSRKFAPYAAAVSLAFESAAEFIDNKNIQINGNPIRKKFATLPKNSARENLDLKNKRTLCIMGGSQGARTINDAAVELLRTFLQEYNLQVIFQTGKKNFERVIEQLLKVYPEYETDKNLLIKPYFDDMVSVLKASDIAVSRAGSLSLSEICASGVVPILVPYPYAAADHQRKNANYMFEQGAAVMLEDSELTKYTLKKAVLHLLENPEYFDDVQRNVSALAKFDATEKIICMVKQLSS